MNANLYLLFLICLFQGKWKPERANVDFDLGFINAHTEICLEFKHEPSIIDGCVFHFTDVNIRNAFKLGLKTLFCENPEIQELIRCFIALCMVPPQDVVALFNLLVTEAPNQAITDSGYIRYFEVSFRESLNNM